MGYQAIGAAGAALPIGLGMLLGGIFAFLLNALVVAGSAAILRIEQRSLDKALVASLISMASLFLIDVLMSGQILEIVHPFVWAAVSMVAIKKTYRCSGRAAAGTYALSFLLLALLLLILGVMFSIVSLGPGEFRIGR